MTAQEPKSQRQQSSPNSWRKSTFSGLTSRCATGGSRVCSTARAATAVSKTRFTCSFGRRWPGAACSFSKRFPPAQHSMRMYTSFPCAPWPL